MKIQIDNKTDYSTKWLRKLFNRAQKQVERRLRNKHILINRLRVDVVYKKSLSSWTGGYAYLRGNYMRIKVIRPVDKMKLERWSKENMKILKKSREERMEYFPKRLVQTFIHELYHCYGYKHSGSTMFLPRKKIWVEKTYNVNWVEKYPVQFKEVKLKPQKVKIDIRMKRYLRVIDLLKDKKSKLKRIQNQIKKYMNKKRYYEKTLQPAMKKKD